jgi:serine protease Do
MKFSISRIILGCAAAALAVAAAPALASAAPQEPVIVIRAQDGDTCDTYIAQKCLAELHRKLARAQERIAATQSQVYSRMARQQAELAAQLSQRISREVSTVATQPALIEAKTRLHSGLLRAQQGLAQALTYAQEGDSGWLGVQVSEVSSEKAKELKLATERGVLITDVESDSPASKAGLKSGDVITDFNGQRIEGTVQFRRLVRETPANRSVQISVWRDARSQQMTIALGNWSDRWQRDVDSRVFTMPRDFEFNMGEGPRVFTYGFGTSRTPRLGINGDDLSGQLGSYFGAPGGEGVLVREVTSGSPAEKAGMKAGDVIVKIDGERIRNLNDLREKLTAKREKKPLPVTVIRKGAETTLNVEIETPKPPAERKAISRRVTL